jgi:hypothetical protein
MVTPRTTPGSEQDELMTLVASPIEALTRAADE